MELQQGLAGTAVCRAIYEHCVTSLQGAMFGSVVQASSPWGMMCLSTSVVALLRVHMQSRAHLVADVCAAVLLNTGSSQ
jgi:hypothetical protein